MGLGQRRNLRRQSFSRSYEDSGILDYCKENGIVFFSYMVLEQGALSGMLMSRFATPFMNGLLPSSLVRQGHLALSHWSFVLMGVHLGLHFGMVTAKLKTGR